MSPVGLTPVSHVPVPHVTDRGTQSATHSKRLPTMSNAPRADLQLLRDPVGATASVLLVLQSVVPLSGFGLPGSGVPATAACHSAFDGSRLRAFSHAACAWNQVVREDGMPPGSVALGPTMPHGAGGRLVHVRSRDNLA